MRLLLDTHIFLWLDGNPEQLSPKALASCEDATNALYLREVSAWEIQIKHQINRLQLEVALEEMIQGQQDTNDLHIVSVALPHLSTLQQLPLHHNEPFDRLFIAQAKAEQMHLVSADGLFAPYFDHTRGSRRGPWKTPDGRDGSAIIRGSICHE
jgi:PIN domain nuclease of toxin-antitoxin system